MPREEASACGERLILRDAPTTSARCRGQPCTPNPSPASWAALRHNLSPASWATLRRPRQLPAPNLATKNSKSRRRPAGFAPGRNVSIFFPPRGACNAPHKRDSKGSQTLWQGVPRGTASPLAVLLAETSGDQYMPPPMPGFAGAAGSGAGMSVTSDSVVRTMAATDAAFCRAQRATFVGSVMPRSIMSTYSSLAAS